MVANAIRQEKEIKCILIRKEKIKLSPFENSMFVYVENIRESKRTTTKKPCLKLISNCSKFAGYKVSAQKSITFLCNNKGVEFKMKNTIPFTSGNRK